MENSIIILIAAVIILVILAIAIMGVYGSENMSAASYSGGATQRFMQELSSANQQPYQTGYNYEKQIGAIPRSDQTKPSGNIVSEPMHGSKKELSQEEQLAEQIIQENMALDPTEQVEGELSQLTEI